MGSSCLLGRLSVGLRVAPGPSIDDECSHLAPHCSLRNCCAPLMLTTCPHAPPPPHRLLELLASRKVKRLILMSDGRAAIVEIPVENTETDFATMTYDRRDVS